MLHLAWHMAENQGPNCLRIIVSYQTLLFRMLTPAVSADSVPTFQIRVLYKDMLYSSKSLLLFLCSL